MATFEQQIAVNAAPDAVFSYVADLTKHGEWARHPIEIQKTSEGPLSVGSTYASDSRFMGKHKAQITVTEYEPSSRFTFEAEDDTGRFRHYFVVQREDGGTRLTKGTEDLKITSLLFKMMTPLMGLMVPGELKGDLKRIKAKLEEGAPAAEAPAPAGTMPEQPPAGEQGETAEQSETGEQSETS